MLTKKPINIQKKAVDSEEENDESQSFALQGWKMERPCKVFVVFFGFTFLKPRWFLGDRLASAAINIAYGKKGTFTGPTLSGAFEATTTKNELWRWEKRHSRIEV